MRDYLYFWHDPEKQFAVFSGVELKDILETVSSEGGIILLAHDYHDTYFDPESRFHFLPRPEVGALALEDTYSWGDYCLVDLPSDRVPPISKSDTAELLYFRHRAQPYGDISLQSLRNRFLVFGHDDGWLLIIYYSSQVHLLDLAQAFPSIWRSVIHDRLTTGCKQAVWIDSSGAVEDEESTFDIDMIQNRR